MFLTSGKCARWSAYPEYRVDKRVEISALCRNRIEIYDFDISLDAAVASAKSADRLFPRVDRQSRSDMSRGVMKCHIGNDGRRRRGRIAAAVEGTASEGIISAG